MRDLIVVMPVYNEEGAIGGVLQQWDAHLASLGLDYEIQVYNDGSKDRTGEILSEVSKTLPRVFGSTKPNSGHGPTILKGYRDNAARTSWLFQIDSDGEMGPEEFSKLWDVRQGYDFLIGQREGRKQPLPRAVVSFISRFTIWLFYGKSIWDVNAPYRLLRSEAFRPLFSQIPDDTFAPNLLVTGWSSLRRLRVKEVPVQHRDRQTGEVSIKKWKLVKAAFRSFRQTIAFRFMVVPDALPTLSQHSLSSSGEQ